jgi:hypothetical protein
MVLRRIYIAGNNGSFSGLRVKLLIIWGDFKIIIFSRQIFIEARNIKFYGNPSSESHTDTDGETDREMGGYDEATQALLATM